MITARQFYTYNSARICLAKILDKLCGASKPKVGIESQFTIGNYIATYN